MSYHLPDGTPISYVGDGHDGRSFGEAGQILVTSGRSAHVKWNDGSFGMHDVEDLVAAGRAPAGHTAARDDLDDSLDVGPAVHTGVRGVLDAEGVVGVLNAMANSGRLADFPGIAEEVLDITQARIRTSAGFREIVSQLDDEESDELNRLAALALLRDAFGAVDE